MVTSSVAGEIIVDLAELHVADASAIQVLSAIADNGVELRGASPYIRLLLTRERERVVKRQSEITLPLATEDG